MLKPIRLSTQFVLYLAFSHAFSPTLLVFGSPVQKPTYNRPDPLNPHFKDYDGGYNVTNKHYLASAAFTGAHCYAIAAVWLVGGLCFGIFLTCKKLISGTSPVRDHKDSCFLLMFFLTTLFSIAALIATGLVYAANERSICRSEKFEKIIIKAGKDTSKSIYKIVRALSTMQSYLRPYAPNITSHLYSMAHVMTTDSDTIKSFITTSEYAVDLALKTSHLIHVVLVTVNLAFIVASLVMLVLHWHPGFIIIIFICWLLTTVCWALTGFHFFLHTLADDTCTAFKDFAVNPQNSSLKSIIPCMDPSYSNNVLAKIGKTIYNFISEINQNAAKLINSHVSEGSNGNSFVVQACNPFSGAPNYTYTPETCENDTFRIGNLPTVLSQLTCYKENSTDTCQNEGRIIPEDFYKMACAYSKSIQNLLNVYPDLESLTRCVTVNMAFDNVVKYQCKPFKASIKFLWATMLSLSISMVVLILTWVVKAFLEKGRNFSRCSIIPDPLLERERVQNVW